jgi:deoxyribonuclease I
MIRERFPRAALWVLAAVVSCEGEPAKKAESEAPVAAQPKPEPTPAPEPRVETPDASLPDAPKTEEAMAEAAGRIHAKHRRTFYCGCTYTPVERIARGTCGYETRADESLSKRLAWERIVPVQAYGPTRPCWTDRACTSADGRPLSGIACCLERDPVFRVMHHDLHNVVPAIAEVAQDRAGFSFGEVEDRKRMYGACDFAVDHAAKVAQPASSIRGEIARAYLYMHAQYGEALELADGELERLRRWHAQDPPDDWERERNAAIAKIQGHSNPYVEDHPGQLGSGETGGSGDRLEAMLRGQD